MQRNHLYSSDPFGLLPLPVHQMNENFQCLAALDDHLSKS